MQLNNVEIIDTYAEAFSSYAARVLITAKDAYWAQQAALSAVGFATSTIHCPCEAGIDVEVPANQTPDKRPGIIVMFFAPKDKMPDVLLSRIGQCILTCPTTACFDAFPKELVTEKTEEAQTGKNLAFFGDGFQAKDDTTYPFVVHKIPVMDGEFIVQSTFRFGKGIAGGNLILQAKTLDAACDAAKAAVDAVTTEAVIMPFPGGVVRSGSKVGSKYKFLSASTNEAMCPTLKGKVARGKDESGNPYEIPVKSQLLDGVGAVLEIVYDGLTADAIKAAMKASVQAAVKVPGVVAITAGNYGGKLGKHQFFLKDCL
ncbi:MAG: formylmethanofuran--tetrahydromethanopterin N-formyltransferase [Candidatus Lokiarchaeota archaeon]|nr:formylmethanofuran--tetrahydromethanopterin N-formyltransferase [Candidatus Lokiarchaeota archaeon]